jgi:secreted Zn-dependent insulinase-like peptidase
LTLLLRNSAAQHAWDAESATWSFDSDAGIQTGILMNVFSDSLAQTTYDAHLAGLNWSLARTASGVVLTCSGYSQHLTSFATNVLEQFFDEDAKFINEKHLRTNKDRKIRYFKSYLTSERADNYAAYYTNLLIHSQGLGVEDSLSLTKQVSLESIKDRHQRIISLGSTKVECLISGNVSKQDAENFFSRSRQIINKAKLACEHSIDLTHKNKNGFHKWIPGK